MERAMVLAVVMVSLRFVAGSVPLTKANLTDPPCGVNE